MIRDPWRRRKFSGALQFHLDTVPRSGNGKSLGPPEGRKSSWPQWSAVFGFIRGFRRQESARDGSINVHPEDSRAPGRG